MGGVQELPSHRKEAAPGVAAASGFRGPTYGFALDVLLRASPLVGRVRSPIGVGFRQQQNGRAHDALALRREHRRSADVLDERSLALEPAPRGEAAVHRAAAAPQPVDRLLQSPELRRADRLRFGGASGIPSAGSSPPRRNSAPGSGDVKRPLAPTPNLLLDRATVGAVPSKHRRRES
jgi:hypothetical protein